MVPHRHPLFDAALVRRAVVEAFRKLDPRHMVRNPVMLVVEIGCAWTTGAVILDLGTGRGDIASSIQLAVWLWFTVLETSWWRCVGMRSAIACA